MAELASSDAYMSKDRMLNADMCHPICGRNIDTNDWTLKAFDNVSTWSQTLSCYGWCKRYYIHVDTVCLRWKYPFIAC